MIRHEMRTISGTIPTSVDIANHIPTAYTLIIQNTNSDGYIYLGSSTVSTINFGFKLSPNQAFTIELPSSQHLYAIASIDGLNVSLMEISRAI